MTTIHAFTCEPDAHSIDIYLTDISDQSGCPRNFRTAHRPPQLNDRVTFRLRDSDTISEKGVAMMDEEVFLGWINKESYKDLWQRLENNESSSIEGKIIYVESFQWERGGGTCFRGNVSIII